MIRGESTKIQELVHSIELGPLKTFVLKAVLVLGVAGLVTLYLLYNFRGLDTETAMDQAQIGRQIAAGAGYSTLYVRPLAIWQIIEAKEAVPSGFFPDTYNFPLNPALNALLLRPVKRWWPMDPSDVVYACDRVIAGAGVVMFLASVVVTFFLVRQLFDRKVAWLTAALMLCSDMLWRFSVSGLPQMAMLLLFSFSLLLLHWAMEAREEKREGPMLLHLAGTALLLGLITLAQPVASFVFAGFLAFVFLWFHPRTVSGLLVFFVYVGVVAPWLVRNYFVCGNPFGLGIYAILDGTTGSEFSFMSNLQPDLAAFGAVRAKLRSGFTGQFENLFSYFGFNAAAPAFFFAMLHVFRRKVTNMFRWCVALMWLGAATGMSLFAPQGAVSANQLHVLFLPLFIAFGLAFLLVLWNRLEINFAPLRVAFVGGIILVSAFPMAVNLLTAPPMQIAWPPYAAPLINGLNRWMDPGDVICSDMPWATAWYTGRTSLLLPSNVKQFTTLYDYKYLGGPITGLYLTPVSGSRPFLSQIAKGDYRGWANFILRRPEADPSFKSFPLQEYTPLPIDGECVFFSNRDRWTGSENP